MVKIASESYVSAGKFGKEKTLEEALRKVDAVFSDVATQPLDQYVMFHGGSEEDQKREKVKHRSLEGVGDVWMIPCTRIWAKTNEVLEEIGKILEKKGFGVSPREKNNSLCCMDVEAFLEDIWYLDDFERVCP